MGTTSSESKVKMEGSGKGLVTVLALILTRVVEYRIVMKNKSSE